MYTVSTATCFLDGMEPLEALQHFRNGGFTHLAADFWQLSRPGRMLAADNWRELVAEYREAANALGIQFYQTHGTTLTGTKWDDPTFAEQAAHVWRMNERAIEASAMIGARWVVMHPFNLPHDPLYSAKKALDKNLSYLAPFIEQAKALGVGIAVENMVDFGGNRRRYCGGDPYELLELVDTIHDPDVSICIDTGHAHLSGIHVGAFIRMAGSRLTCTHVNDNARDSDRHLPPYLGTIDWADTLQALREVNYRGEFCMELSPYRFPTEAKDTWCRFTHDLAQDMLKQLS